MSLPSGRNRISPHNVSESQLLLNVEKRFRPKELTELAQWAFNMQRFDSCISVVE